MIVVANVASRLVCDFGDTKFVLAIQTCDVTRDDLLKTYYGLHVLCLEPCILRKRNHQKERCHIQDAYPFHRASLDCGAALRNSNLKFADKPAAVRTAFAGRTWAQALSSHWALAQTHGCADVALVDWGGSKNRAGMGDDIGHLVGFTRS
jgi:hypothetical protein